MQCRVNIIMGMQDITGVFALPLAHPYSDVPPPYGRRRTPFVPSRRPRPGVFDLRVTREAPRVAAVQAADFGSENRAWAASRTRRRWRPTLMAMLVGLVFGSVCVAATHIIDTRTRIRTRAPSQDTFYESAISMMPEAGVAAPVAAVLPPESIQPVPDRQESFAMRTDGPAAQDAGEVVTTVALADASKPATAPQRKHARIAPARSPAAASTASVAPAAASAAAPKVRAAARHDDAALAAASSSGSAAAVGMTAAEFTRWLAATREPVRQSAQIATPADTGVAFTDHPRLIEP
ncbi:hypothetical protein QZM52_27460 [Burkholderia metallica]|uniref:Serine protease n=1 Tax=Burkholderia metallica TaxID=488729 RepID=A0ABT8PJG9_9BURK|nr:hypothetical protein [Burkholderia metallica]MDN7935016.1 hypothetical protein [Burkholderia metallica]